MKKSLSMLVHQWRWPLAKGGFSKSALAILLFTFSLQVQAEPYLFPQGITVSGKVVDESGSPMPGVNLLVQGTTNGTTTDVEGQYTLSLSDANATVVFSFIGYLSEEIAVNGRTKIDLSMTPDILALSEVVVVGYGTQKKSSLVGSIGSVKSKELAQLPVPSMEQAIQGRVAGVVVTNNGSPGNSPIVRIRGINSINFASNPLYVVDGIIGVGNFQVFDTKDVESIEVLKDASSAAIYGSRASAGVVIITTKKGTNDGKIHVDLDSYVGVQSAWRKLDLLNTEEYIKYGTALLNNSGAGLPSTFSNLDQPIYAGATQTFAQTNTDWQDELFGSATIAQHHLSLSGNSDKSKYFASVGYFKQDGIMVGTDFERYNLRFNTEHKVSKIVTFGQTLLVATSSQRSEQVTGGRSQIQNLIRMLPYLPVLNPNNLGGYGGATGADGSDPQNPIRSALQDRSTSTNVRILGTLYLNANITKWLTYRFNLGVDFNTNRFRGFFPAYSEGFNARAAAIVNDGRGIFFSPIYTNQLTFDKTYGKHAINATGVIEYQTSAGDGTSISGNTSANNLQEPSGLSNVNGSGGRGEFAIYSYIGRLNYEYDGKYILSATIRRDGSSNFASGFKFGTFPSVGLGWRISEESFMRDIPAISELKLRASYGSMGFLNIGNYPSQATVQSNTAAIIGGQRVIGAYYDQLENKALTWETTDMTSVGADVGLFNNKLTFSAEYYYRDTKDLILGFRPPLSSGFSAETSRNIGRMTNSGFDFQAGYKEISNAIKWNIDANIGFVKNEVLALALPKDVIDRGQNADFGGFDITRTEVGQPVQSFFGWKTAGLFQSFEDVANSATQPNAKPGDVKFEDINKDGQINADDRVYLGSFLPDFSYGFNLGASYKNWDFTAFFQGVSGNKVYNGTKVMEQGMLRLFNAGKDVLRAWTPTNPNTDVPRAVSGDPNGNTRTSNRFLEDGSYFRLKNISIGYALPTELLNNLTNNTVTKFRVYVSAQNLLTLTNYSGYDPEVGSTFNTGLTQGIDYGQFPQARTIMAGIQIGF
jgi:TonB-dependent starch-binding outer membrane protein SusC